MFSTNFFIILAYFCFAFGEGIREGVDVLEGGGEKLGRGVDLFGRRWSPHKPVVNRDSGFDPIEQRRVELSK